VPSGIVPYRREQSVAYAHTWAYQRNGRYYDFEHLGGDCTNFASQCLYAGAQVMDYTPTFGWFYSSANYKAPAWPGVDYFYNYLIRKEPRPGPFGFQAAMEQMEPGDFAQLSFLPGVFGHTPVIVSVGDPPTMGNILVATHTDDTDNRPLSVYENEISGIRFIHIAGVHPQRW
jgi:hypothetical protein